MRRAVIVFGAGAVLLAGCTASPSEPQRLSPEIPGDPIDLTQFATAPCELLDQPQLAHYYITGPGVPKPPGCTWTPSDTRKLTYHASVDTSSGGIEALYQHRAGITGFEPTDVHSYPAIHHDAGDGHCTVQAGVANDTLLTVTVDATDPAPSAQADPCGEADRFAGTIIGYQGHRKP
ncbi:DUF3558 domain-containing protein [Amycolatopsis sp. RTGN1]|uniref:DUF3558 domain-containing protein n=1 Tax=Amycolatopsis ponsaeliensis TaxID=2992142 RepID=UPI00254ADD9E|nr:DUF3558 domain-containing protein [Amycolatopsis sp. RTGN1]